MRVRARQGGGEGGGCRLGKGVSHLVFSRIGSCHCRRELLS